MIFFVEQGFKNLGHSFRSPSRPNDVGGVGESSVGGVQPLYPCGDCLFLGSLVKVIGDQ